MKKEIEIKFKTGTVLIPDSNTRIFTFSNAIATPAVIEESSGTSIRNNAQLLESDFAQHIHDLYSTPTTINAVWTSGTSEQIVIYARKRGKSENGMSPWYIYTSDGCNIRIAESVHESAADLNQCALALVVHAARKKFRLGTKDNGIRRSINTLTCLHKN